ncbi:MAG: glutamine synthetase III [Leptospirales bacterium]|nr:glutamine synthetase III [Leptospirales bacterium]
MKEWAVERGATHFSHWFQPMTGRTLFGAPPPKGQEI